MDALQAYERVAAIKRAGRILREARDAGGDFATLSRIAVRVNYELYEAQDALHDARRAQAVAHV